MICRGRGSATYASLQSNIVHCVMVEQGAFDSFAMGNYPYPSTYMGGALPAWPMRAACECLAHDKPSQEDLMQVLSLSLQQKSSSSAVFSCLTDYGKIRLCCLKTCLSAFGTM